MQAIFAKGPGGCLIPIGPEAEQLVASLCGGCQIVVEVATVQHPKLRRKLFALLRLAFESWEPPEVGRRKDFKQFRKDLLILAGHCRRYVNGAGEVRLEAKSLSLAECEGVELTGIYAKVLDVVWTHILQFVRYENPVHVERVIEQLITYESGDHASYIL